MSYGEDQQVNCSKEMVQLLKTATVIAHVLHSLDDEVSSIRWSVTTQRRISRSRSKHGRVQSVAISTVCYKPAYILSTNDNSRIGHLLSLKHKDCFTFCRKYQRLAIFIMMNVLKLIACYIWLWCIKICTGLLLLVWSSPTNMYSDEIRPDMTRRY